MHDAASNKAVVQRFVNDGWDRDARRWNVGVAPTQRIVTTHGVEMWRLADGKIVEHWGGSGEGWSVYRQITADAQE